MIDLIEQALEVCNTPSLYVGGKYHFGDKKNQVSNWQALVLQC